MLRYLCELFSTTINLDDCEIFNGIVRFKLLAGHNLAADIAFDCFIRVEFIVFSNSVITIRNTGYKSWMGTCLSRPTLGYGTGKITQRTKLRGQWNSKHNGPKLHTNTERRVTHTYVYTTYFKEYFM